MGGDIFIYSCCASLISFEIDCVPPPNYRSFTTPALNYRSEESIPDSYDKCELGLCAGFMLIFVRQGFIIWAYQYTVISLVYGRSNINTAHFQIQ